MNELKSHPGLQFCVLKLSGTLNYTLTIANKAPKLFQLPDEKFEKAASQPKEENAATHDCIDMSAAGLEIRLVKNSGDFNVKVTGIDGSSAELSFTGFKKSIERAVTCATAAQQTKDTNTIDTAVQTSPWNPIEESTSKNLQLYEKGIVHQNKLPDPELNMVLKACGQQSVTKVTPKQFVEEPTKPVSTKSHERKRKSPRKELGLEDSDLDADSGFTAEEETCDNILRFQTRDDLEPRHLYLRGSPINGLGGDFGELHVDMKNNTVRWEEDRIGRQKKQRVQNIDVSDPHLEVVYKASMFSSTLEIRNRKTRVSRICMAHSLEPTLHTKEDPKSQCGSAFQDIETFLSAVGKCIDNASGRQKKSIDISKRDATVHPATRRSEWSGSGAWRPHKMIKVGGTEADPKMQVETIDTLKRTIIV